MKHHPSFDSGDSVEATIKQGNQLEVFGTLERVSVRNTGHVVSF